MPVVDTRTHVFHIGVHRLCTVGGGIRRPRTKTAVEPAFLLVSDMIGQVEKRLGGRATDGVGPRVVTLTPDAERRRR